MKEIEPFNRDEDQLRRVAARHGLCFHINQFSYLTEHRGWKSETRQATDEEVQMWVTIFPGMPIWRPGHEDIPAVPVLDATEGELAYNLLGDGPFTLNVADFAVLRHMEGFAPCNDRESLQRGLIGHYQGPPIYVSRAIPKGYFYQGAIEAWRPPEGERVLEPEMDPQLWATIQLRSLVDHSY